MNRSLDKNALEWTVFGIGLALVLGTLGYLVREAATTGSKPPDLVVQLGSPQRMTQGFQVPVTVYNRGDDVAEDASVTITVVSRAQREEAILNIAFLPNQARHQGWVIFRSNPRDGKLQVGPVVYASP